MAGSGYQADQAAMTQAKNGFDQCAQNAQTAMNTLRNELDGLLSTSTYAGSQAQAFQMLHAQIEADMKTASDKINTIGQLIGSASANYETHDTTAATSFNNVAGTIANSGTINRLGGVV